jgi:hypothetical protein
MTIIRSTQDTTIWNESATESVDVLDGKLSVIANSPLGEDLGDGRVFINGGRVTLQASEYGILRFNNPVNSGKMVTIYGFNIRHNQSTSLPVDFYRGGQQTTSNPNWETTALNNNFSHPRVAEAGILIRGVSIADLNNSSNTLGVKLSVTARVSPSGYEYSGVPFVGFAPDETVSIRVQASAGLVGAAQVDFSVAWKEEDI